jgi:glycolate oxidase FAD binding subunit
MTEAAKSGIDADHTEAIVAAVASAVETARPLYINGGGSKRLLAGRIVTGSPLEVGTHRGIIDYQPSEMVLTARSGTPLTDIISALDAQQQCLGFEPPTFGGQATLGGTLACNINGPARPWRGSIRDAVLGVELVNGKAQVLGFGGQVMKNVAGYDVSRLQAGALGTLGVITQVSLKVVPKPEQSLTLRFETSAEEAIATMNQRSSEPKPLSAAHWHGGLLFLRLSGAASAVQHTAQVWGGETVAPEQQPWTALTEMTLPFFTGDTSLWRLSMNSASPHTNSFGEMMIDWGGAQRWVRGEPHLESLQRFSSHGGGHCTLFRGGDRSAEVRAPLKPVEQQLQLRLKQAFDPAGVLNPGRLYSWM